MKKRVIAYLKYIDNILEEDDRSWEEEIKKHLVQISFFAHERLVHLIVTVLFALATIGTVLYIHASGSVIMIALLIALLALLVPYIMHYYLLENSVQKMYRQYDEMQNKLKASFKEG